MIRVSDVFKRLFWRFQVLQVPSPGNNCNDRIQFGDKNVCLQVNLRVEEPKAVTRN